MDVLDRADLPFPHSPPQHGSWAVHRSCLGWAAPCPSGACGEFERPSRSAKDQVAAETARRTCRASDWRPDKRPRTRRSAECGYAPSLFPPSARCSGGTCGSAGRQGGFQSGTALPPCRSAGRQSRLPSGLSPGRRRRPHHRGKVAGTRVANAGMGDRRGREHPWRAPLYPVCAHSSPSGCGCKPDRQGYYYTTYIDYGLPIRLSPTPTICSMSPWTAGKGQRRRIEEAIRLILDPAFPKYRRYSVRREGDSAIRIMKL